MHIDPTAPAYGASGSNATTLGSIAISSNTLTISCPAGWAAGMGIDIAGAGPGGADLITSVIGVSGAILTLAVPAATAVSAATVNHDDTEALSAAIASGVSSGVPVFIPNGKYNITGNLVPMSSPVSILGQDPYYTEIINRGRNNNPFTINYATVSPWPVIKKACTIGNFQVSQAPDVPPGSGGMFTIGAGAAGLTTGLRMRDIVFNGVWEALHINAGQISNWFERLYFRNLIGGNALVYNSPGPNGDCHCLDWECSGYNTGILIEQADTMTFANLKTNFSGVRFAAPSSAADIVRVRFINPSIEGDFSSAPPFGYDFGANGSTQVSIIGGGIGIMPKAFNNLHLNAGGYVLTNVYNTTDSFSGWCHYGNVTEI